MPATSGDTQYGEAIALEVFADPDVFLWVAAALDTGTAQLTTRTVAPTIQLKLSNKKESFAKENPLIS
jgi:uncharacterized protein (DUF2236 family)